MFCVEVDEGEFKLFQTEEESEDLRAEIANSRAEGMGKDHWVDQYQEIYTEWVEKCKSCDFGYVMPDLVCEFCKTENV